ncbi:reverse transcriptase-like protein, partial [Elysia marginata]
DFNGHSPLRGYKDHNKTGEALENISHTTNLIILQDRDSPPTQLHRAHNTLSRLYLTILSSDLHHKHNIQMLDDIDSIPNQAGFRTGQQKEDQLFRLSQKVIDGFQKKKNTTAVFVDLQQAYDRVWRKGLLWKMREVGIHGRLYQWVNYFLVNRMIQTKINNRISSKLIQEEGLPQGSYDLPDVVQTEKALYADALVIWHTNKHPGISARLLNEDLDRLQNYCDKWKLKINSSKTVYSVFTKSHIVAKKNIRLSLRGTNLKKEEIPIYLGVKLDRQLALKELIQGLRGRANKRLQLVKRLASTSWGADKNTLRQLYIGYVRSLMEYNLALQSISSKTNKDLLDRVQSQAVHFISGGMRSTPTAACEIHTNIEPLGLGRDAGVMNMVERYKKSDKSP